MKFFAHFLLVGTLVAIGSGCSATAEPTTESTEQAASAPTATAASSTSKPECSSGSNKAVNTVETDPGTGTKLDCFQLFTCVGGKWAPASVKVCTPATTK